MISIGSKLAPVLIDVISSIGSTVGAAASIVGGGNYRGYDTIE